MDDKIIQTLQQLNVEGPLDLSEVITMAGVALAREAGLIDRDDSVAIPVYRINEHGKAALRAAKA